MSTSIEAKLFYGVLHDKEIDDIDLFCDWRSLMLEVLGIKKEPGAYGKLDDQPCTVVIVGQDEELKEFVIVKESLVEVELYKAYYRLPDVLMARDIWFQQLKEFHEKLNLKFTSPGWHIGVLYF